jgi:hypothetical protein
MRILFFILLLGFWSCTDPAEEKEIIVDLDLKGEMLFEGANTLQMDAADVLGEIGGKLGVERDNIRSVKVKEIQLNLSDEARSYTESLLFQVVSNTEELKSLGTLNPLQEGNAQRLSSAEDSEILPYLKDQGTTFVLDLNITEEMVDEMKVLGNLKLKVEYVSNS